jgi:hypothetical protein
MDSDLAGKTPGETVVHGPLTPLVSVENTWNLEQMTILTPQKW